MSRDLLPRMTFVTRWLLVIGAGLTLSCYPSQVSYGRRSDGFVPPGFASEVLTDDKSNRETIDVDRRRISVTSWLDFHPLTCSSAEDCSLQRPGPHFGEQASPRAAALESNVLISRHVNQRGHHNRVGLRVVPLVFKRGVATGELHDYMADPFALHLPGRAAVEVPRSRGKPLAQGDRLAEHAGHALSLEQLRINPAAHDALKEGGEILLIEREPVVASTTTVNNREVWWEWLVQEDTGWNMVAGALSGHCFVETNRRVFREKTVKLNSIHKCAAAIDAPRLNETLVEVDVVGVHAMSLVARL